MAEVVNSMKVSVRIDVDVTGNSDGSRQIKSFTYDKVFTDGTGNDQIGSVYLDAARSLAATNEDFDLSGATYKDGFEQALAGTALKVVFIKNLDTVTAHKLTLTRPASAGVTGFLDAASDAMTIHPGGMLLWVAPGPDAGVITATTADLLNLAAASTSTFDILFGMDNT